MEKKTKHPYSEKALPRVATRGRIFKGTVVKVFPTRIVIELERTVYVHKYERYYKKKTRIHASIPHGMLIALGDYVSVQECRPLSKIIHHLVVGKIKSQEGKQ